MEREVDVRVVVSWMKCWIDSTFERCEVASCDLGVGFCSFMEVADGRRNKLNPIGNFSVEVYCHRCGTRCLSKMRCAALEQCLCAIDVLDFWLWRSRSCSEDSVCIIEPYLTMSLHAVSSVILGTPNV